MEVGVGDFFRRQRQRLFFVLFCFYLFFCLFVCFSMDSRRYANEEYEISTQLRHAFMYIVIGESTIIPQSNARHFLLLGHFLLHAEYKLEGLLLSL